MTWTMIRKELRENLRWALVALLLTSAAFFLALFKLSFDTDIRTGSGIASPAFQAPAALISAVAGFLLGLMVALHESRRDRWSFLVHRPVTRTQIFLAKSAAALILYTVAVGLPAVVASLYSAIPGRFPFPFVPAMLLPRVADFVAGTAYVFAGMIVAMRHAHWLRTRLAPLAVAFIATVLAIALPTFPQAITGAAVCVVILAVAAHGQFATGGLWQRQPRPAKAALFLAVATGIFSVGTLVAAIASELLTAPEPYAHHVMSHSGKVYVATHVNGKRVSVDPIPGGPDLDRTTAAAELTVLRRNGRSLFPYPLVLGGSPDWYHPGQRRQYRDATRYAQLFGNGPVNDVLWYYVHDQRRIVGYDVSTALPVASAGPDGFTTGPDARPFDAPALDSSSAWTNGLIALPHAVYAISPRNRTLEKIFDAPAGQTVRDATRFNTDSGDLVSVISTGSHLHFVVGNRTTATLPVSRDTATYGMAHVTVTERQTPDRIVVWYQPGYWQPDLTTKVPAHVEIYARDGRLLSHQKLPPLPAPPEVTRQDVAICFGIPLAAGIAATFVVLAYGQPIIDAGTLWGGSAMILAGLIAAAVTQLIARRHALPPRSRTAWAVTNFFFSFAGLLTMLAVRDSPARLPCPHCRKPRPVDTDTCPHCSQPWPHPTPDGTEIFEPATTAAAPETLTV